MGQLKEGGIVKTSTIAMHRNNNFLICTVFIWILSMVIFILGIVTKALYDKRHEGFRSKYRHHHETVTFWFGIWARGSCLQFYMEPFSSLIYKQSGTTLISVYPNTKNQSEFKITYAFRHMNPTNPSNKINAFLPCKK